MRIMLRTIVVSVIAAFSAISGIGQNADTTKEKSGIDAGTGVLLLAHGGKQNWNDEVMKVAAVVNQTIPVEVAFGMASKRSIQRAVDKLVGRGARKIVAVPLFVSPHSTVITSTEYLLGARKAAPADLAVFAKMDHGHSGHDSHQSTDMSFDPLTPVKSPIPIQMASALGAHPLVAEILLARAREISREPRKEVVVVVAHGPVSNEENDRWLADMRLLVDIMRAKSGFSRIEYLTVRDDAPEPIRSRATEELRAVVKRALDEKSKVLIVPLLLSYGGIEEGIKKRLDGLEYNLSKHALLPDERLADWVLLSAKKNAIGKK
jgi:sirohydrochlorin cobaltochelatase